MSSILKFSLFLLLITSLTACKFGRFVIYNFADITDYKKFPKRVLTKSSDSFEFHKAEQAVAPKHLIVNKENVSFETFMEEHKTVAFLVIRNDSLLYEGYFNKYDSASITTSFSMAKSITSILIGFAIQDGLIQSVNDPVTNYIPELVENGFEKVTLKHLLQMTSGMEFNESYSSPFGHAATYYYGRNLRRTLSKAKLESQPGEEFNYQSGSTQLLGLVLDRVLTEITVTDYLQKKLWQPLGMEYNGSWSLDKKKEGLEKTFCCINARAIDFAKIGRLYLNKGNWNGKQLLNEEWVKKSTQIDSTAGAWEGYQYQWWIKDEKSYMAQGILGQYIYINSEKNLIFVRMGKNYGKVNWSSFFKKLEKAY